MPSDDQKVFGEAFCAVLEQVAFMFGEPADSEASGGTDEQILVAHQVFDGPRKGQVCLAMPWSMGRLILRNILGSASQDDPTEAEVEDAVGEVLNITCNHFLSRHFGEQAEFAIALPRVHVEPPASWPTLRDAPGTMPYVVDSAPVLLRLEGMA